MSRFRRLMTPSGLIALAVVAAAGALSWVGVFRSLDSRLADRLFLARAARPDVLIVAIDDESLQKIGRWPWPRATHGKLLETLAEVKPAAVVFDVGFFEASHVADDEAFARAMETVSTVLTVEGAGLRQQAGLLHSETLLAPIALLRERAAALGHVHTPADADGIVRRFPLPLTSPAGIFEPLAVAALRAAGKLPDGAPFRSDRISFAGPSGTIQTVSYADVLEGRVSLEPFKDAIVFVGATAPNLHDSVLAPASAGSGLPGVELHAQVADQVLQELPLFAAPPWSAAAIIVFLGAGIALTFPRGRRLTHAFAVALAFGLAYNAVALIAFSRGMVLPILWPNAAIAGIVVGMVGAEYLAASKERKFIRETFSRYVSGDVVAHLLEHPELLRLGGEAHTLTILFSDIRGFTALSEKLSPAELTRVLNRYLTRMSAEIMAEGGVLDKYIGDAVMAFWGAPVEQRDHAERAARAALAMQQALREFNRELAAEGLPVIAIGIGINTGEVIVGNMGSAQRFDYTVIGDAVNLASRLEGLNKAYGTTVLIAAETLRLLSGGIARRELDRVAVKGKAEAVAIYEIVSAAEAAQHTGAFRHFAEGLVHYRNRRWDEAAAAFQRTLELKSGDGPSEVFLKRIEVFRHSPPPVGWDGSWQAETK